MDDLSQLSNEELMKLKPGALVASPATTDLSHLSNEDLMKLKAGTIVQPPESGGILNTVKNIGLGALKGASDIGATIMSPIDKATDFVMGDRKSTLSSLVTDKKPLSRNEERRAKLGDFFHENADPDSLAFKGGELGADIAGTAGVGGVLAKTVKVAAKLAPAVAQYAPKLAAALESGGFKLNAPAATTTTGKVVNAATRVGAGATVGGASAGLINPDDAGTGVVLGGALPVVAKAAGTVGKLLAPEVSPEVRALYQKAKDLGIEIPADRITNSKPLNAAAASLNYIPLSGRAATEERMVSQLNRAVSRTFGQDSDNVTAALRKAQTALGDKFEVTLRSNSVKADDELVNELVTHLQTAVDELSPQEASIIGKQVDAIMNKVGPNGEIDGQAAYNIKRTLDRIGNRNSNEAYYARELKKSLMGALNRSLGPDEAAAFAKVRQQYGNMLDLEHLAPNGAEGEITPGKIANLKNIKDKNLQDLADISAQFIKSRENPHGAAQRIGIAAVAGPTAFATGTLPVLAGGVAAGRAANTALNMDAFKHLVLSRGGGAANTNGNALPALRALVYNRANRQSSP